MQWSCNDHPSLTVEQNELLEAREELLHLLYREDILLHQRKLVDLGGRGRDRRIDITLRLHITADVSSNDVTKCSSLPLHLTSWNRESLGMRLAMT